MGSCSSLQYLLLANMLLVEPLLAVQPSAAQPGTDAPLASFATPPLLPEPQGDSSITPHGQASTATQAPAPPQHLTDPRGPSKMQTGHTEAALSAVRVAAWRAELAAPLLAPWPTWAVWALRATLMHQQLLGGRSATLWAITTQLTQQLQEGWVLPAVQRQLAVVAPGSPPMAPLRVRAAVGLPAGATCIPAGQEGMEGLAASPALLAAVWLEMAAGQYAYGYVDPGEACLRQAGEALGLQVNLTGGRLCF